MVPETLYITVQIIDRYLSVKNVKRSKLQLVGVGALLVSYLHSPSNFNLQLTVIA